MPQFPFYSTKAWKDARSSYLRLHRYCEICALVQIKSIAMEVDHIRPIEAGGSPLDPANFSAKCKMHHSQKTRVLDTPGQHGRDKLVTTGADGFPIHVEKRYGKAKAK